MKTQTSLHRLTLIVALLIVTSAALGVGLAPPPNRVAFANTTENWSAVADTGWYNAEATEFEIATAEQLAGVASLTNEGNTFANTTFTLTADIDLAGRIWTPIGTGSNASGYFAGTVDGNRHVISNMTTGEINHGLFGIINGGTVLNLGLENASVVFSDTDSSLRAGLLADWLMSATVKNCYTTGVLTTNATGSKHVGGIAGQFMANSQLIGCYSTAVITSKATNWSEAVGGLVGSAETSGTNPTIADCWFGGQIVSQNGDAGLSTNVGGILGMCFSNIEVTISNCLVISPDLQAPCDIDMTNGNGGMWIAWYQGTGCPTNCYWPIGTREDPWPAAIAFATFEASGYTDGLYFSGSAAGTAVDNFNDSAIVDSLNQNASEGVVWVIGKNAPTFEWDVKNHHVHAWSDQWTSDDASHWHECTADGLCLATENAQKDGYEPHSWGQWSLNQAPTAKDEGSLVRNCSVCGHSESATLPALNDIDYEVTTVAPTCTEAGSNTYTYTKDGQTLQVAVVETNATGHTEATDAAVAPTCTQTGLTEGKHCSVCNEVIVPQQVVDATGHNYLQEWLHNDEGHWHKCENCDATSAAEAHTWGDWTVTREATATEAGRRTHQCSVCGHTQEEEIAPTEPEGLSGGQVAAIAVGSTAGVSLIGFLLWFFLVKRKRS